MSRPMLLMSEIKLLELYEKFNMGVPVLSIIRHNKYEDFITPPTLTKLLRHYHAYKTSKDVSIQKIIHSSLFPEWLNVKAIVQTSPSEYFYQGKMPLGVWKKRDTDTHSLPKNQMPASVFPKTKTNKSKAKVKNGKVLSNNHK